MIDTIVIRLHGLEKYHVLITWLDIQSDKSGYSIESATVDNEELEKLKRYKPQQKIKILKFNKTGEFLAKTATSKRMNSSHHYAFTFYKDLTNDFVEFNFSVPKYKYGSNVLMFVEHLHDRDYKWHENGTLKHNFKKAPH